MPNEDSDSIAPAPGEGKRVLLTGATGFVGRHLHPVLVEAGYNVVCGSRHPEKAAQNYPDREWTRIDLDDADSIAEALRGVDRAIYLVHHLQTGAGYYSKEQNAARQFAQKARQARLSRVVYLGGVEPSGKASLHLKGRLATGRILREEFTSTVELRAAMIIGPGSASWNIVEDLAARLAAMLLPAWMQYRSQPIAIDDVVVALTAALDDRRIRPGWYNIPGPQKFTHEELLRMAAEEMGKKPLMFPVPVLTPFLSSFWIAAVTRTPLVVAREIVQGLQSDLVSDDENFFELIPGHRRMGIREAMSQSLRDESNDYPVPSAAERLRNAVRNLPTVVA